MRARFANLRQHRELVAGLHRADNGRDCIQRISASVGWKSVHPEQRELRHPVGPRQGLRHFDWQWACSSLGCIWVVLMFGRPIPQGFVGAQPGLYVPPTSASGGGGGFTDPTSLSGLQLYLNPTSAANLLDSTDVVPTSNGETIKQITDLSGNSNHATQGTDANRSTWVADVGNGSSVLWFSQDGALNDRYSLASDITLSGDFTICFLANITAGVSAILGNGSNNASINVTNSTTFRVRDTASTFSFTSSSLTANNHLYLLRRSGTDVSLWVDGAASSSNPQTISASWLINRIGCRSGANSDPMNGLIGALVIYNAAHTNANCNLLADYIGGLNGFTGWVDI